MLKVKAEREIEYRFKNNEIFNAPGIVSPYEVPGQLSPCSQTETCNNGLIPLVHNDRYCLSLDNLLVINILAGIRGEPCPCCPYIAKRHQLERIQKSRTDRMIGKIPENGPADL